MTSNVYFTVLYKCDGANVIIHNFDWFFINSILRNLLDTRTSKVWKILVRGRRYSTMSSKKYNPVIGSDECLLLFTPSCCCECFYHLKWLVRLLY